MKYVVVSVRDFAMGAYGRPIFCASRGQAVRSFSDEINREHEANEMYRHPADFDLYVVGSFNDEDGVLSSCTPEVLIRGVDCKGK